MIYFILCVKSTIHKTIIIRFINFQATEFSINIHDSTLIFQRLRYRAVPKFMHSKYAY